ncbi:cyclic nucleotide-binding domain-containing protein [Flavobacteriaceae bacterium R38]|nr:cyclic nucleotide-binding domain-containing protein [Flavobacteriaceae bacterium R38]
MNNLFLYQRSRFNNENLFEDLPQEILDILNANKKIFYFTAGQVIFSERALPKGIYIVETGKVKKYTTTSFDREHIFYVCAEKEFLGYHALLSEEPYPDSAKAMTKCKIMFIPKYDFLLAVQNSVLLKDRLLKSLSHEFGVFINSTKILAKYSVRERTALNLLILSEKFKKEEGDEKTNILVNRDDLANMVGTAKESLVRMLKDFKEEKLISSHGREITILNLQGLIKASNFK